MPKRQRWVLAGACAVVMALSACQGGDSGGATDVSSPDASSPMVQNGGELPPLDFPTRTREERLAGHGALMHLKEAPELPPVIREVAPEEEQARIDCLAEYGFSVQRDEIAGGTAIEVQASQTEAFWTAEYMCAAQYPLAPQYYQHYNAEQLRMLYDWQLDEAIPCLEGLGFTITEEPPTFEHFYETYASNGYEVWLALFYLDGPTTNDTEDQCPGRPPTDVFFASNG